MSESNLSKFKKLLAELFMFDQADLDFGIYRIMNARRDEITRFLDNDLLPQVRQSLAELESGDRAQIETDLAKAIEQATELGVPNPETIPKVKELREQLAATPEIQAIESEVFSHLYEFFRRYYSDGDFLSLRRYKAGVYAIPYEGEEVKLHWANSDQYYIKTSETFRDYAFKLADGRRVHFKLADADTETNNNKAANGNERRFILKQDTPLAEQDGELIISFEYRPDTEKRKQAQLNTEAVASVLSAEGFMNWTAALGAKAPTEKSADRTVLEKHLTDYTAKNTFDYFIHKDLGGFLRRELDFYIKNEVMYLDDIESDSAPRVEQYLAKIKAMRRIAHKVIDFLAQLEDFQKKLWLKKKFVIETNYCVTLDRIPESLYPEIAANDAQREEWVTLFGIDEIKSDKSNEEAYSKPLTLAFLKANINLVVDTALFGPEFRVGLLSTFGEIDSKIDGLLVHSENFQALCLIEPSFRQQVKCIYIDPPYNTNSSAIPYKNNYRHSSWCTMMRDRVAVARNILRNDGALFVSIDKTERTVLEHALDDVFGADNHIEELIWTQATANSQLPNYSTNHEYVEVYARDRVGVESDAGMFREPKPGYLEIVELLERIRPQYPSVETIESEIKKLFELHIASYKEELEASGREWDAEARRQDRWRGIYPYNRAEYRDSNGHLVAHVDAKESNAVIWVWSEISAAAPASKQSPTTKDPNHFNFRYYKPIHPITGKPCAHPRSGWKFPYEPDAQNTGRKSFVELDRDSRIAWGDDEEKLPRTKGFLHEVETNIGTSVFYEYNDGESELTNLFGESGLFLSPKSSRFVRKFITQTTGKNDWFIDFFGGSGSSGHAVIAQNREDGGKRRHVLVEMGSQFDNILLPRIKKVVYSPNWRNGKPTVRSGGSEILKYIRLESYEDALNNLDISRSSGQSNLLEQHGELREDYTLRYMLDVETRGSASLLNVEQFADPFSYKLNVSNGGSAGETRSVNVDLVETFNYLIGLRVKHIDSIGGFRVIEGTNPDGEKVLIIWRNTTEKPNVELDQFFQKQAYKTGDNEFDLIYVNGDNNLENLRRTDETWKVRLIEQEFHRLMFDVRDV
jgi:adenine-specific DNA-methyltransferase